MFSVALRLLLIWLVALSPSPAMAAEKKPELVSKSPDSDLDGQPIDPFRASRGRLIAFVFVSTECPVANAAAPEILRVHTEFTKRGVDFWLVYPDPDDSPAMIRRHMKEFGYQCGALRDPHHVLVNRSRVRVTPEAAIFGPDANLLYHGRIDNRYVDFGKARPKATQHDFARALDNALTGKPVTPPGAPAIGCFIEQMR